LAPRGSKVADAALRGHKNAAPKAPEEGDQHACALPKAAAVYWALPRAHKVFLLSAHMVRVQPAHSQTSAGDT
jgi:hypothetical protein